MCFQRCSLWWQLFQCLTSFCHVFLIFAVLELNFSFLLLQPKISFLSDIDNFNVMSHIIANREKGDLSPGMWYAIFVLSYFINDGLLQVTTLIHTTLLIGQNHYCHHHHMNALMIIITIIWMTSWLSSPPYGWYHWLVLSSWISWEDLQVAGETGGIAPSMLSLWSQDQDDSDDSNASGTELFKIRLSLKVSRDDSFTY